MRLNIQEPLIIAVDFDGTCVTHEYPNVGKDVGAVPVLRDLVAAGHKLMLWTMRSDKTLDHAVRWFESNGIPLWGVNENPGQKSWTSSNKQYAQLYIDDAAIGCPLIHPTDVVVRESTTGEFREPYSDRPFVDWGEVRRLLIAQGVLSTPLHPFLFSE